MPLIKQSSKAPTNKVTAGALGGAVSVVAVFVAGLFGIEISAETAASIATLSGFGFSYIVRDKAVE